MLEWEALLGLHEVPYLDVVTATGSYQHVAALKEVEASAPWGAKRSLRESAKAMLHFNIQDWYTAAA